MAAIQPRYSAEEFARRGDAIYERDVLAHLASGDGGKFVAIDIETGAYEVAPTEIAASDQLRARIPDAQIWMVRVGSRYLRSFGFHPLSASR